MKTLPVTAVILTKNSEHTLPRTISSLTFCNQILVIDSNSEDSTVSIAKKHGATVIENELKDFGDQRNFAQDKVNNNWILYIDSDEVVSNELAEELQHINFEETSCVYRFRRRDNFMGHVMKYGEVRDVYEQGIIRLIHKNAGKWVGKVHEVFNSDKEIVQLTHFIEHYPHPTIAEFIADVNEYSTLRAKELYGLKKNISILEIIFIPFAKFIYTYGIKQGYKDSFEGFIYSFMMSFHSFLVRAKLYQYRTFGLNKV